MPRARTAGLPAGGKRRGMEGGPLAFPVGTTAAASPAPAAGWGRLVHACHGGAAHPHLAGVPRGRLPARR